MSQSVHLICYGPSDIKCLPYSGITGRVAPLYSCSSLFNHSLKSQIKIGSLKGGHSGISFTCRSSSSGRNRNPDFSKQNRNLYSRGRNKRNEERDGENLEESDLLSAKNGPMPSLSGQTKYGATAAPAPGPREKEIVELFRKVQAQLRERTAAKEEKRAEPLKGKGKDDETVDSLLKLLRKHSVEQAKRNSNAGGHKDKDFMLDHPERNGRFSDRKNTASFDSNNRLKDNGEEPNGTLSRPASNFRRKSPISRLPNRPVNSVQHANSIGTRKKNYTVRVPEPAPEPEPEPEPEFDIDFESDLEPETEHDTEFEFEPDEEIVQLLEDENLGREETFNDDDDNEDEPQLINQGDLSACKIPELRALAKSRGMKGYSKMKKAELLELLSGSSD